MQINNENEIDHNKSADARTNPYTIVDSPSSFRLRVDLNNNYRIDRELSFHHHRINKNVGS